MRLGMIIPGILVALMVGVRSAPAQEVNCANEFRSGKLYFAEGQKSQAAGKSDAVDLYQKAVARFKVAVEVCPDKYDYHARYAMALAQLASVYLEDVLIGLLPEDRPAMVDSVTTMYELAGHEFDAAYDADDSKSSRKFVRENREHYWVERYNAGLKRLGGDDPDPQGAVLEFQLALMIDPRNLLIDEKTNLPRNAKAYSQGAIAYINLDDKEMAADWVTKGLEIAPEDEKLNELQDKIYFDVGRELTVQAEDESKPDLAVKAAEYLSQVSERQGGKDPNTLFELGLAKLAISSLLADTDSVAAEAAGMEGAEIFGKAGELAAPDWNMPTKEDDEASQANEANKGFYLDAKYNQIQCYLNAHAYEQALAACRDYLTHDCANATAWLVTAQTYSSQDKNQQAVSALMASKSIQGGQIDVSDAKANAQGAEAAAYSSLGDPTFVFSYQDSEGNQVNTAIWCDKKQLKNFILGDEVGKIEW